MKDDHYSILTKRVSTEMAEKGLKCLTYGYKRMRIEEFNAIIDKVGDRESEEFREEVQRDLGYVGTFGLYDPLNDEVADAIR